jgi:hyperosmotically inducible periplasmic protein
MTKQTMTMSGVSVLLASLALAGCSKPADTQTARTTENTAVVQGQPSVADSATKATQDAKDATRTAGADIKESSKNAADQASNKVADAVITTSVNAELAKDPKLSSLRIDVDTDNGRVALKGTAPDAAAKERATQLASNVKGVVSVDNQLTIGKG